MSEQLHPGTHLDADSFSAFVEGVLPEHERVACLTHLAECARCREIVWLSQPAVAEAPARVVAKPVRFWKRWLQPMPALAAAAVACVLVVSVYYRQANKPAAPAPEIVARSAAPVEASAPPLAAIPVKPAPRAKVRVRRVQIPAPPAPAPAPLPSPAAAPTAAGAAPVALAQVVGTVTDPAGAVIPSASVNLVDSATGKVFTSTSSSNGNFSIAGLTPGQYEMKITVPGFKQMSKKIELQPQEIARADSRLDVGQANESVTVTAEASLLKTESGELSHSVTSTPVAALPLISANGNIRVAQIYALPSKLPSVTTVAKDKIVLAADSAGALFVSTDSGKTWNSVKEKWPGKIVRLSTAPDPADASNASNNSNTLFQLTTDSASVWLSRDGKQWDPAPAGR